MYTDTHLLAPQEGTGPAARVTAGECARLAVVQSLHLVDQPADSSLEALIRAAREATGCEVAMVTLIDEQEALHVAPAGGAFSRTPRDQAFCDHVIRQREFLEIADLRQDLRFAAHAGVQGPQGWRHYAAVPLVVENQAVGTLCVLDRQPRALAPEQVRTLCALADVARDLLCDRRHRLQLQDQVERLRDLTRAAGDWAWELDAELRLSWVSGDLLAVTGLDPTEGLGRLPDAEPLVDAAGQLLAQGGNLHDVLAQHKPFSRVVSQMQCPRGTLLISRSATPVFDSAGRFRGYRGAARDVTARVEREGLLRDRAMLESVNRVRHQFFSRVSHELRTPLNAILGFAQLMTLDAVSPLVPTQRQRADGIQRAGAHLLELVDDVLDIVRLEQSGEGLPLASVPLDTLLPPLIRQHQSAADSAGLSLCLQPAAGLHVRAQAQALVQLLSHLLSNAIKYNRPGGTVTVTVQGTDGRVRLQVRDTGLGLTRSEIDQLFQPFSRPGAQRHRMDGTGLGLVLARQLAKAMGASLDVDSEPGQGSCFTVELQAGEPAAAEATPLAPAPSERPRVVLYVEDEPLNALLMQELFKSRPAWTLHVAVDGAEGVALAQQLRPDLALIDMNLPDINGTEVLRRLKADERTCAMPCIALSADAMQEQVSAALAAGFDDYWTKPMDLNRLLAAVAEVLGDPAG